MNLSSAKTTTTVTFSSDYKRDMVILNGKKLEGIGLERVVKHLVLLREKAHCYLHANVETHNSFPTGAGIASSASGFAALTLAASEALGLKRSDRELSRLARRGSGSACRSIPNGFVIWHKGIDDQSSYAESLFPSDYWDLHDLVVVVDDKGKKESSSLGHKLAITSPLLPCRLEYLKSATSELMSALRQRDVEKCGMIIEQEAFNLHAIMMTSNPSVLYWLPSTVEIMLLIKKLRLQGIPIFFTIDAGPNVHAICEAQYVKRVKTKLSEIKSVQNVIDNGVSPGAKLC